MNADLCKPVDLLITQLSVPPVCIRPSVAVQQNVKNEDDLTIKLAEMINFNKELSICIAKGLSPNKLIENWNYLQWTVAQYLNAETPGLPLNLLGNNKPIRALA